MALIKRRIENHGAKFIMIPLLAIFIPFLVQSIRHQKRICCQNEDCQGEDERIQVVDWTKSDHKS
jgi:hypothetical protein